MKSGKAVMKPRLHVCVFSESPFTFRGHGVHSAYEENIAAIVDMGDIELVSGLRGFGRSTTLHVHTLGPIALVRLLLHRGRRLVSAHITPASFVGSIRGARIFIKAICLYMRTFYNLADLIVSVSEETTRELTQFGVKSPIKTIHNAIDGAPIREIVANASARRRNSCGKGNMTVLAVGQIQPRKGVDNFLTCATAMPDLQFIWVGGMPFGLLSASRTELIRRCEKAPSNVKFVGMLPRVDVFRYYADADVFFLPSQHETFGLAVLEAAMAGLPLLLSGIDCYKEWLGNSYMAGNCVSDYIRSLRQLQDPDLRSDMGKRAEAMATQFDASALQTGLREAYKTGNDRRKKRSDRRYI